MELIEVNGDGGSSGRSLSLKHGLISVTYGRQGRIVEEKTYLYPKDLEAAKKIGVDVPPYTGEP